MHMLIVMALPIFGLFLFFVLPFWTAFPVYLGLILLAGLVYYGMYSAMGGQKKGLTGKEKMIGGEASAIEEIDPEGRVDYEGEIWSATAEGNKIARGSKVKIMGFRGTVLRVEEIPNPRPESEGPGGVVGEKVSKT
jgi:membrane-bound ClpP family serine protease